MFRIYKNFNKNELTSMSIKCNRDFAQNLGSTNAV